MQEVKIGQRGTVKVAGTRDSIDNIIEVLDFADGLDDPERAKSNLW